MFRHGKQYGAFFCDLNQNDFHKNISYLIVMAKTPDITVSGKSANTCTGSTIIIKPLVEHKLQGPSPAWSIYLAPYSSLALSLNKYIGSAGIAALPEAALPFNCSMPDEEIFNILDMKMNESNSDIDPRLASVLNELSPLSPTQDSLIEVAKRHGLSTSRLRVIAKEQIGVPLSMLLVWQKSVKSLKAYSAGSSLSEAAHLGGFSDQAHFTRTVRKMFGITPSKSTQAFDYKKR